MADTKVSALVALSGANLAAADLFPFVDVSDTSMAASGTDKSVRFDELSGLWVPKSAYTAAGDILAATAASTPAAHAVSTVAGQALLADPAASDKLGYGLAPCGHIEGLLPTGALGQMFDRMSVTSNMTAPASGTLYLTAKYLPKGMVITSISYASGSVAANTPTNQWFGIFTAARAIGRLTVDDTTTAWGTGTTKTLALSSTYTVPSSGLYYFGIMIKAGAAPNFKSIGVPANTQVLGLAPILYGSSSTGLTNPASCPDPAGALTISTGFPYYCYWS